MICTNETTLDGSIINLQHHYWIIRVPWGLSKTETDGAVLINDYYGKANNRRMCCALEVQLRGLAARIMGIIQRKGCF